MLQMLAVLVTLLSYLVACILGCWTSQMSQRPWHLVFRAIRQMNTLDNLRAHIVRGVQSALQLYTANPEKLCESVAQLVLQNVDALGPGALNVLV